MTPNAHLLDGDLTRTVIGGFFEVFRRLGYGYREHIYALALERELTALDHEVAREVAVMVYYRGEPLARQSLDMVVDRRLVIEIKSSERLHPNGTLQLFGYLCATDMEVGLLLHFGREPNFYRVVYENRLKHRTHE